MIISGSIYVAATGIISFFFYGCVIFHCWLPRWLSDKGSACPCKRCRLDPWVEQVPWEYEMATHSSVLPWRIPRREQPGRLQSVGSLRVRHD